MLISTLRSIFEEWFSLSALPFGPELLTIISVVAVFFVIRLLGTLLFNIISRFL